MRLIWSRRAIADRRNISNYIAIDNPRSAEELDAQFVHIAHQLLRFPEMGRPGDHPGTREIIPHRSYRMVYSLRGEVVRITTIIHTARQWPPATS